jgi:hypothetical protein
MKQMHERQGKCSERWGFGNERRQQAAGSSSKQDMENYFPTLTFEK